MRGRGWLGWLSIVTTGAAAYLYSGAGHTILLWLSLATATTLVATFALMNRFAVHQGIVNREIMIEEYRGRLKRGATSLVPFDSVEQINSIPVVPDPEGIPDRLAIVDMAVSMLGFALFVYAIIVRANN